MSNTVKLELSKADASRLAKLLAIGVSYSPNVDAAASIRIQSAVEEALKDDGVKCGVVEDLYDAVGEHGLGNDASDAVFLLAGGNLVPSRRARKGVVYASKGDCPGKQSYTESVLDDANYDLKSPIAALVIED